MKLVVILPALNEEESIVNVLDRIPREIEGIDTIEKVVIDDGSTDNTQKLLKQYGDTIKIIKKGGTIWRIKNQILNL